MRRCPSQEQLRRLLAEELPPADHGDVETHIQQCPHCQDTLERLTEDPSVRPAAPVVSAADTPVLALCGGRPPAAEPTDLALAVPPGPADDDSPPLTFLGPSTRPGALGRLGHYEVLQVLGRGGFGIVLRAFDEALQRSVAIKVLAPELAVTAEARRRFLREARSAAAVRHANVVEVFAVEERPLPYLVMELVDGETLQQRLDRAGPLAAVDVLRVGRQLAEGLAAAHQRGLIHRDVKPANVLIESRGQESGVRSQETGARSQETGVRNQEPAGAATTSCSGLPDSCLLTPVRVKLTDFGLARTADDATLTRSGMLAGTPMYMSPEQARGEKLDHRSDLFSLGSVLYAITAGRPPFLAGNTPAILKRVEEEAPRPIPEILPETPEWLSRVIARLMAKDPKDRFQTAAEVAELLAKAEAGVTPTIPPLAPRAAEAPGRGGRPPGPCRSRASWWVGWASPC